MNEKFKRVVSLLLLITMLLGMIPTNVFAEEGACEVPAEDPQVVMLKGEPDNQSKKLNWENIADEEGDGVQDYYWPLNQFSSKKEYLPYQTLAFVSQYEPVRLHDIKYE